MDWLPPAVSTVAGDIDRIFWIIFIVTGIVFVAVELAIVVIVVKYRGRKDRKAYYIEGNNKAEIIWTVTPAILVLALAFASQTVWSDIKDVDSFPADALEMKLVAEQFEWHFTYPGVDGVLGTDDDFEVRNQLHMPVNRPVILHLESVDVIHSFFVPVFRLKQDIVPGLPNNATWFEATEVGEYEGACAELCGTGHTTMDARVSVKTQQDYDRWVAERS